MLKVHSQGDLYTATGDSARILREILNERGEDTITLTKETFHKTIPVIIHQYKETLQEYAVVNNKEVKIREGSPGNWSDYSEYLIGETEIAKIGSVLINRGSSIEVEIACVSTIDKEAKIYKFSDNELFTSLAHLMHAQNIQEVIYTDSALSKVFTALGLAHYKIQKKGNSPIDLLERHLTINMQGYIVKECVLENVLQMDEKAADALLSGDIRIESEINCATPQGKRLLQLFIRAPSTCKEEILRRQEIITEILEKNSMIRKDILSAPDTFATCKSASTLSVQATIRIYRFLGAALKISKGIGNIKSLSHEQSILKDSLDYTSGLVCEIEDVIDLSAHAIKENCTEELRVLNKLKNQKEQEIYAAYTEEIERKSIPKAKLENSPVHGYCIKIPRTEENKLTTEIKLTIQKSGILFTTETIKMLNHKLASTFSQIKAEHAKILKTLTESFTVCKAWIEVLNHTVALLDVFTSLAAYASNNNLVCPVFTEKSYRVDQMYHPLLPTLYRKRLLQNCNIQEPVKNSLEINDTRVCIITGPNMGGKTTFLKTVGIISILAQIGSYVPAAYANIPIFKKLFIRIGASDNPAKGISTFMAEMMDISAILNEATEDSLVIIDELGRGTSDEDGYAIAASTVEYIAKINAMTLFATHFHELAHMPGVVNKRVGCIESKDQLIMTYKIEDGYACSSYGINTARRMGFPEEVLQIAEAELQRQEKDKYDSLHTE
ncbi:DNA mismatch repair protein MSH2 [Nematocida ausubeli]|nr:DNA mismatch repair protein MSH2 [Nematocida ausubeli]